LSERPTPATICDSEKSEPTARVAIVRCGNEGNAMDTCRRHLWSVLYLALMAFGPAAGLCQTSPQAVDPASLLTRAEATAILGELKGEPELKDGLRGKKLNFDTLSGSWLSIEVYSAEAHWEPIKGLANDVEDVAGLGDAAYSSKRGSTRQVFVKKGALMMEVDSSAGLDAAKKAATAATKRLP
jgi:hypothetical protein